MEMLSDSVDFSNSYIDYSPNSVILKTFCEKNNEEIRYKKSAEQTEKVVVEYKHIESWNQLDYIGSLIKDIFLPKGYPKSVSSDYLEYQLWDTCQAFCSSISGTLSMSAVMEGVGVGSSTATPVSAAITWIMKDGTGMVGSILFAWSKGSRLDSDCKKWRLFADILNDAAMCLELYIPFVMHYSMYMLCLSTAMKALVGVAGSATRAALTCHQAVQGNMADVSAKDGSQEIFVNLCAYIFGIFVLKHVTESDKIWAVMCAFIILHLYSNYKAVTCLRINMFNAERYRLCLRSFLSTSDVPTVEQVNRNESVFLGRGTCNMDVFGFEITLGASIDNAVAEQSLTPDDLSFIVSMFQSKNYIIIPNETKKEILVSFRKSHTDIDILMGYFHAVLAAAAMKLSKKDKVLPIIKRRRNNSPVFRLEKVLKEYNTTRKNGKNKQSSLPIEALMSSEDITEREFSMFCKLSLEQGWNLNKTSILIDEWRADWKYVEKKKSRPVDVTYPKKAVATNEVPMKRRVVVQSQQPTRPPTKPVARPPNVKQFVNLPIGML